MAQLDKTFPTNDCSMCIESPKFNECSRHPNITMLTLTEVDRVEGEAGDFRVTLIKEPEIHSRRQMHGLRRLRRVLPGQESPMTSIRTSPTASACTSTFPRRRR